MKMPTLPQVKKFAKNRTAHTLVRNYLLLKTLAEMKREEVDAIHLEILTEAPIFSDAEFSRRPRRQILKSNELYLSTDEDACKDFYAESNARLKAAGIKPEEMESDYCPALVAENVARAAAREMFDYGREAFGIPEVWDLKIINDLETLIIQMVTNEPSFEPLAIKEAA